MQVSFPYYEVIELNSTDDCFRNVQNMIQPGMWTSSLVTRNQQQSRLIVYYQYWMWADNLLQTRTENARPCLNRPNIALVPSRQIVGCFTHLFKRPVQPDQMHAKLFGKLSATILLLIALRLDTWVVFRRRFTVGIAQRTRRVGGSYWYRARASNMALHRCRRRRGRTDAAVCFYFFTSGHWGSGAVIGVHGHVRGCVTASAACGGAVRNIGVCVIAVNLWRGWFRRTHNNRLFHIIFRILASPKQIYFDYFQHVVNLKQFRRVQDFAYRSTVWFLSMMCSMVLCFWCNRYRVRSITNLWK